MKNNSVLLHSSQGPISKRDLTHVLNTVGIEPNDTLMVHSRLFLLGQLNKTIDKENFVTPFIETLMEAVGPGGTVIYPTFTTKNFFANGYFSVRETKSETGILSEEVRKRCDSLRTPHPVYSVAVMGMNKERFLNSDVKKCFGKDSFFDLLHKENLGSGRIKFLTIGIVCPPKAITYVHHIEKEMTVPYRYNKIVEGVMLDAGKAIPIEVEMFVRDRDSKVIYDGERCWKLWLENNIAVIRPLGDSFVCLVREKDLYEVTSTAISKEEDFLCLGGYSNTLRKRSKIGL
jgi:aminoglycoside N3'-acetyltransferase